MAGERMTTEDVDLALVIARTTPKGRQSSVKLELTENHKELLADTATAYITWAREDLRVARGDAEWVKPKPIDYALQLANHIEALATIHRELAEWRQREDFLLARPGMRALVDYSRALAHAAGEAESLRLIFGDAQPREARWNAMALGTVDGKIFVNERPMKAFELLIILIARTWEAAGLKASAERTAADASRERRRDTPFVRFVAGLNDRLPDDVRHRNTGGLGDAIDYVLRKQNTP